MASPNQSLGVIQHSNESFESENDQYFFKVLCKEYHPWSQSLDSQSVWEKRRDDSFKSFCPTFSPALDALEFEVSAIEIQITFQQMLYISWYWLCKPVITQTRTFFRRVNEIHRIKLVSVFLIFIGFDKNSFCLSFKYVIFSPQSSLLIRMRSRRTRTAR